MPLPSCLGIIGPYEVKGSKSREIVQSSCSRTSVHYSMAHSRALIAALLASTTFIALSGCSTSTVWENEFRRGEATASPLSQNSSVRIREVSWDRVNQTIAEINEKLAKSDTHYDDWTPEQKSRLKAQMLKGLQVSTPANEVELLGRSEFRTTDRVRPDDGSLEAFARKIGATTVIVTSSYLGKTDTIRQEAITEYRSGTSTRNYGDDSKRRDNTVSETSTIWVPIGVQSDENAFIAFFLRDK